MRATRDPMECVLRMFVFRKEAHRFSRHFSNREVDHDLFVAVRMLFSPKAAARGAASLRARTLFAQPSHGNEGTAISLGAEATCPVRDDGRQSTACGVPKLRIRGSNSHHALIRLRAGRRSIPHPVA